MRFTSLSAEENSYLNDLCERAEAFMGMMVAPPLQIFWTGTVPVLGIVQKEGFPARITGQESVEGGSGGSGSGSGSGSLDCLYSFVEVTTTPADCQTVDMEGGRIGFIDQMPAKELTGNTDVPTDSIVWMTLADTGDHYLFLFAQGTVSGGSIIRVVRKVCRIPQGSGS